MMNVQQGEMYWVDLNPIKGKEQRGLRPCLVISGKSMNQYSGLAIVCPLTSVLKHYVGNVILSPNSENGLTERSEVLVSQIRTVDQKRFQKRIGVVHSQQMKEVLKGLVLVLTH